MFSSVAHLMVNGGCHLFCRLIILNINRQRRMSIGEAQANKEAKDRQRYFSHHKILSSKKISFKAFIKRCKKLYH
jgi:hypothetical protein